MMATLNYYYDKEQGVYRLYMGDTVIVELPNADPMTDEQAKQLASELWAQYQENNKGVHDANNDK
jgi:hypothetical protein